MGPLPATDENGVEYLFICEEDPDLSSDWQTMPYHEVPVDNRFIGLTWRVKARDMSPHQNETGWSVRIRVTNLGQGQVVED